MVTADDHAPFINYLNTQELAIDVWNADSYQNYASGSVKLSRALRQGQPTKVVVTDVELFDPQTAKVLGTL